MAAIGGKGSKRPRFRGLGFLIAAGAVAAAAVAVAVVTREDPPPPLPLTFEHSYPDEYVGAVWFTISTPDADARDVTVRWQRLSRTFEHRSADPVTYRVLKGAGKERSAPMMVEIEMGGDVSFGFGEVAPGAVDLSARPWDVQPFSSGVAAPRPANADSPTARAAVDESVSYGGMDLTGIGVRSEPQLAVAPFTRINHGSVFTATCWRGGQELTNSNFEDPADDGAAYTSDVWFRISTPEGEGLISDVWFSRRGTTDKMNLPPCPGTG